MNDEFKSRLAAILRDTDPDRYDETNNGADYWGEYISQIDQLYKAELLRQIEQEWPRHRGANPPNGRNVGLDEAMQAVRAVLGEGEEEKHE